VRYALAVVYTIAVIRFIIITKLSQFNSKTVHRDSFYAVSTRCLFFVVLYQGYFMDFYTLALGLFMFCHGGYILVTRAKAKHQKARLDFMTKALGRPFGFTIYSLIYVILPIVFGAYISYAGINNVSLSALFAG
jgi:hypothetical protein